MIFDLFAGAGALPIAATLIVTVGVLLSVLVRHLAIIIWALRCPPDSPHYRCPPLPSRRSSPPELLKGGRHG